MGSMKSGRPGFWPLPINPWKTRGPRLGKSNLRPEAWKVKKDGGAFDQFTGATITPRAVVKAARRFLEYVQTHRDQLFAPAVAGKGQPS